MKSRFKIGCSIFLFVFLIITAIGVNYFLSLISLSGQMEMYHNIDEANTHLRKNPRDVKALRLLAQEALATASKTRDPKDWELAIQAAKKDVDTEPQNAYASLIYGSALNGTGKKQESIEVLKKTASLGGFVGNMAAKKLAEHQN